MGRQGEDQVKPSGPELYFPDFDLGVFRLSVARYVKLLIRSRWRSEPGFLDRERLAAWGLEDIGNDRWPAWKFVHQAAHALEHLNLHFLPRCGSGGVRFTDESTPEGRLICKVAFLSLHEGGGPDHNRPLLDAAMRLRDGQPVNWERLVSWGELDGVREDLDRLPVPNVETPWSRLERIEELVTSLVEREKIKDWYDTEEFARLVGKSEFTCREWCRLGRIHAVKKSSGRGKHKAWAISHDELSRFRREGLIVSS